MIILASIFPTTYGPAELDALLSAVAKGDQDALAALYDYGRAAVYGLALSYLRNGHDAEDVTQDTFVRVWEKAPTYRSQGTPMAWVLTITKNLALMRLRERGKIYDLPQEDWNALAIPSPAVSPEERQVLLAALGALDTEERQIILLHAVSGLKHREIGELLEIPLATALSKYHRGLKKLRNLLSEEGGDRP